MKKCSKGPLLSESDYFNDIYLKPFGPIITSRRERALSVERKLLNLSEGSLYGYSDYHLKFGLFFENNSWVFREWAPNATDIHIICSKTSWQKDPAYKLENTGNGVFEGKFRKEAFCHGDLYRLIISWDGGEGDRIPTASTRVVQDSNTFIFNAQVWHPEKEYEWAVTDFNPSDKPLLIYEAHTGMALEESRVGTYIEFEKHILPKIKDSGYTAIQLMAIQEHPYYGSFGYHVSSFFAPSSRFGTPEELKSLIDAAHKNDIRVLIDIVHSHAVNNEIEGISKFDGTHYQFFHDGPKGYHSQWDSRCFDYGKLEVLKFLLSNIRYWIEEFKIDGFRFDGITSMLFEDHGLGRAFTCYDDYFNNGVDVDALTYLYLANRMAHDINPELITIAEDVSGYPGLAASLEAGGTGFDFRYAMGIADYWIKLLKDNEDHQWNLGAIWHELTTKRDEERTISYAESHDQALVGDKTLLMHLMCGHVYTSMNKDNKSLETVRGVALHKMIRLITLASADSGYLNFIGNEFGHPEWVDFPSAINNFSYEHARRQWSLKYNKDLYFSCLFLFDKKMIELAKKADLFKFSIKTLLCLHEDDKVLAFQRGSYVFIFNFHWEQSYSDYMINASAGKHRMIFESDAEEFGGLGRLAADQSHFTLFDKEKNQNFLSLYLPTRTAIVLKLVEG